MTAPRDREAREPDDVTRLVRERLDAGDALGVALLHEPDALLAYPADRPARGRDAIRAAYQHLVDSGVTFALETPLATLVVGDLALTSTRSDDGMGSRVQVVRRQDDGTWMRAIDRPEVLST